MAPLLIYTSYDSLQHTKSSQFAVSSCLHCLVVTFNNSDSLYSFCAQWLLSLPTGSWLATTRILSWPKPPIGSPYIASVWTYTQKKGHLTMPSIVALVSVAAETCLLSRCHTTDNADMSQCIQILKNTVFWIVTECTVVKVYQHSGGTFPPWWWKLHISLKHQ
jgi:hypothetical protein